MAQLIKEISKNGVALIKNFEGFSATKYDDGVGVMTIGYGHAIKKAETFNKPISMQEAESILAKDLAAVDAAISKWVTVPLNQNQYDAIGSFIFNLGAGNFAGSTLLKKLNAKDYEGASKEFIRWNKGRVKGALVEMPGLTRRRLAEQKLFTTGPEVQDPLKNILK